jgi:hypothetical protein
LPQRREPGGRDVLAVVEIVPSCDCNQGNTA